MLGKRKKSQNVILRQESSPQAHENKISVVFMLLKKSHWEQARKIRHV